MMMMTFLPNMPVAVMLLRNLHPHPLHPSHCIPIHFNRHRHALKPPAVCVCVCAYTGPLAGFYERRARGDGVFFTHADFIRINAQRLSDVLRTVNGIGELGMRPNTMKSHIKNIFEIMS